MIGSLMLDVAGTTLTQEDIDLIKQPQVGGVILFARNVVSAQQVRELTDAIREVNAHALVGVDQEGGRVRRLREGFSPIPAMGAFGQFFEKHPVDALTLSEDCGWLMAAEVLSVGIDISFAPVLDIDHVSNVIGDRGFHREPQVVTALSQAFMHGMKRAGMATSGKHFPGHGSCAPDSHVSQAIDDRSFNDIFNHDLQPFIRNLHILDALMPAHVIYPSIDDKPAGFSSVWLKQIVRDQMGFDGVLFSDDLSMKAAHVAGGADARVIAAVNAGCDMVLICNDRDSAKVGLEALASLPTPNQTRLARMRANIPDWQGSLADTCRSLGDWDVIEKAITHASLLT